MFEKNVIKTAYNRLFPAQILSLSIVALNTLIDSILTARLLGTEAMAAIALFNTLGILISISQTLAIGIQILCAQSIGSGDRNKVVALFSTGTILLVVYSVILTALFIIFSLPVAELLGAKGSTAVLLSDYIKSYSIGITGQVFSSMLVAFLPLNGREKRCYASIVLMIVSNAALDMIFVAVLDMGITGMGLATAISYLSSSLLMFTGFISDRNAVYFRFVKPLLKDLPRALYLGLPNLLFLGGCALKAFLMNISMMNYLGTSAVAVMNVMNSALGLLGSVNQGCGVAELTLGSIYYGEKDRSSLVVMTKYSFRITLILSTAITAILMLSCNLIPNIYFQPGEEAWGLTKEMLLMFPNFLILNTIPLTFRKIYQCQGQMLLVNVITITDQLATAVFAITMVPIINAKGVWLSFSAAQIVCILIIIVVVFKKNKKPVFSVEAWMLMDKDFGAKEGEYMEFSVRTESDVTSVSETVMNFCLEKGIGQKESLTAGLSVEEMAGNVIQHGLSVNKKSSVDIRVVAKDGLTVRIRDDCPAFNPKKRLEQFETEDPTKNVGIRLIEKMASDMIYQYAAGINTLLIQVKA